MAHRMEPSEFADHVHLFDRTFKCHPLSREKMRDRLEGLQKATNELEGQPGFEPIVSESLVNYVLMLQKQALFGLRLGLLVEELGEWTETVLKERTPEEQAKELADVEYVLHGAYDTMGYDSHSARGFVAAKNHVKIQNSSQMKVGEGGKVIKPEDQ